MNNTEAKALARRLLPEMEGEIKSITILANRRYDIKVAVKTSTNRYEYNINLMISRA